MRQDDVVREPAVAGRFYPRDAAVLRRDLSRYLGTVAGTARVPLAVMVPHAGYIYSGAVAGQVFARCGRPERVIVLCPNHTGDGPRLSVFAAGRWRTPLGEAGVDAALAQEILAAVPLAQADTEAHEGEHAIEVEVPFLQMLNPAVRIVPMVVGPLTAAECRSLGEGLARVVGGHPAGEIMIAASSDMTHYQDAETARRQDELALARIEAADADGLYETVHRHRISMCGVMPMTAALHAARALGARDAAVVAYDNSGTASGDLDHVVGYAGVIVPWPRSDA